MPGSWRNAAACGSAPWTPSSCSPVRPASSPTITSASRTSLFNIHTLQWDEELCRFVRRADRQLARGQRQHRPLRRRRAQRQAGAADGLHRRPVCRHIRPRLPSTGADEDHLRYRRLLRAITGLRPIDAGESACCPRCAGSCPAASRWYGRTAAFITRPPPLTGREKIGLFNDFDEFGDFPAQPAIARGLALCPRFRAGLPVTRTAPPPGCGPACRALKPNAGSAAVDPRRHRHAFPPR
ncbi:hypothetical protein M8494_10130 [Serratia ureilytica]